jgi:PAS domain S-box-containing protein
MKNPLNVLVVEDSPMAAQAILRSLQDAGYALTNPMVVESPATFTGALSTRSWDVVISDYVMPSFNGTQALEIYKYHNPEFPFICVSGEIGEEKAAEVIRSGAHNYVSKSHLSRLGKVVESEIAAAETRSHIKHAVELASRLAAIVDSTDDAILSKDLAGTILTWNAAAETMFGYSAGEIIGRNISTIVPPDNRHELREALEKIKRGEHVQRLETNRMHKDGRIIEVALTISPIKDEQGKVVAASSISRDITERRRLEREHLKLIEQLQGALSEVKQLSGLLPICANCKRIRDEQGDWQQVEVYVHAHSQADFTHGICPDCTKTLYPGIYERMSHKS